MKAASGTWEIAKLFTESYKVLMLMKEYSFTNTLSFLLEQWLDSEMRKDQTPQDVLLQDPDDLHGEVHSHHFFTISVPRYQSR